MKTTGQKTWELSDVVAWAVVFGSHEYPMVESLWDTQYGAEKRSAELNDKSETCPYSTMGWQLRHEYADRGAKVRARR